MTLTTRANNTLNYRIYVNWKNSYTIKGSGKKIMWNIFFRM